MSLQATTEHSTFDRLGLRAVKAADWLQALVFPPICGHCDRVDARFCRLCRDELARHPLQISHRAVEHLDGVCATGAQQAVLASAVKAFKYEGASDLRDLLTERLIKAVSEQGWLVDTVAPVPLHADRLLERGYNQASLLGERLAQTLGIRFEPGLLGRIRNTDQQARLSGRERLRNVVGAFAADPAALGLSVLLVDDVVTTGATLSECAAALRARNAEAVYAIAISHA